ncbi:unnamed protein product, partial [marine sediment metagenome]
VCAEICNRLDQKAPVPRDENEAYTEAGLVTQRLWAEDRAQLMEEHRKEIARLRRTNLVGRIIGVSDNGKLQTDLLIRSTEHARTGLVTVFVDLP